jgi:membrane associated rhomboid family serine protease
MRKRKLEFTIDVIAFPILFVLLLWIVFWVEVQFKLNFRYLGVYPQKIEGLKGILFSPFVHSNIKHLFNNSVPLLVLSTALFYFYRDVRWRVLLFGLLMSGIITWIIGRPAYHIGASGVVYMLAAFLFFKGIFSKQYQLTALSLVVVFLYGGILWYLFPIDSKISWEGHLAGFVVGIGLALVFRHNHHVKNVKYEWEREDYDHENDSFLQQFDDEGNFIESPKQMDEEENIAKIKFNYTYRSRDEEGKNLQ